MTKAQNMSAEIRVIKIIRCDNGNEQMGLSYILTRNWYSNCFYFQANHQSDFVYF